MSRAILMKDDHTEISSMQEVLTDLVKGVVRSPDKVRITTPMTGPLIAFVIKVDQDDVRRLLGKQGKHFKALQTIIGEAAKAAGREAHLAIDEKSPTVAIPPIASRGVLGIGGFDAKRFQDVKDLLTRVVSLFVFEDNGVAVSGLDVALSTLLEVKVKAEDYAAVYGREAPFEYGPDGHIIGAIKNFFDGIGKNNGRVIRIALSKT